MSRANPASPPRTGSRRPDGSNYGWPFVLLVSALSGVIVGLVMPRGPVTAGQAVLLLALGLITGVACGFLVRSSWAFLAVPGVHMAAFELARMGAVGPTVDMPRLDSAYGLLALLLGRGVYVLLGLTPLVLGVGSGRWIARLRTGRRVTWWPLLASWLPLAAVAVWLLVPARTTPVTGPSGRPAPGSVALMERVELGGSHQWITVRGASTANPVLLYLSGGPGQSDLPFSRVLFSDLASEFVVVGWDQRGAGKSYPSLEPVAALTLEQVVADTIELAELLRARFGEQKIYLLGESWGSTLGVLAAQRRPDLFHAFIGSGQMVSQSITDRIIWRDLLAFAEREGDWQLYDQLITFGEPPYDEVPWGNAFAMNHYGSLYGSYTLPAAYVERLQAARLGFLGTRGSEYSLIEKVNVLRGLLDTFTVLYPQLQGLDFRHDVTSLAVPLYILDGEAELSARRGLTLEWFDLVDAPIKRLYSFADAGHSVVFEQAETFREILTGTILPETYSR